MYPRDDDIVIPYEYVGRRGDRVVTDWPLEPDQLRRMKNLLIRLEQVDRDGAVGSIIFKKQVKGIYYAKINGRVALRPRLCIGPNGDHRVTFLERVDKKDNQERPSIGDSVAPARLETLEDGSVKGDRITLHKSRRS